MRIRPFLVAPAVAVLTAGALLAGTSPASAVVPPTPPGLPVAIEPLGPYVGQTSCDPTVKPGTAKLGNLLAATYPGTSWSSLSACGTNGDRSEHYEGRAIDWMVSVRNAAQKAQATALIGWLLATDSAGNKAAVARRLGVMYVIWNNRQWGAWSGTWEPYQNCATHPEVAMDSTCHRNHVHLSLTWNGALGRTSFWTRTVSPPDYGPCRPSDLNWAPRRAKVQPTACPRYPELRPAAGASATKAALVTYSGAGVHLGMTGPIVSAVQRGVRVPVTGTYDLATRLAVLGIQVRHLLQQTGSMTQSTWRVLLAARR